MDEVKIVKMYRDERYTLRHIAEVFKTDHHKIRRILVKNNIPITRRSSLKTFSEEHKQNISNSCKGRVSPYKGKKASTEVKLQNMVAHLFNGVSIKDLEKYVDFDKLKFLNRVISRHRKHFDAQKHLAYLERFYFDETFNKIYTLWLQSNKNKWYMPSLDHKIAKSNGGNFELDNLHFITWFENRAKAEMSLEEWTDFKIKTNTKSELFI